MISDSAFKKEIWRYYRAAGRSLPWRQTQNTYFILVSEIMLQQTQVARAEVFYEKFIKKFPSIAVLAKAERGEVLEVWQGLGYNRRALALHKLAEMVLKEYGGKLPRDRAALESLPGIGPYTAGAIRTFAFNEPDVFIETNIRRVFIHFFFPRSTKVVDKKILSLIEKTLDPKKPREWYFALMDYGAMLGISAKGDNPNRRSAHYAKQSKFSGSDREVRGKILRLVLVKKKISIGELECAISQPKERIQKIAVALAKEGFMQKKAGVFSI
jgi:A/G-specific adenine glycosylase